MKCFAFLILLLSSYTYASCDKFQYNNINYDQDQTQLLENKEFCTIYSYKSKTGLLSYTKINKVKSNNRINLFASDKRIPIIYRSQLKDYKNSSYDRGHLFPVADSVSKLSQAETFLLSNMAPQNKKFNEVDWRLLKEKIRNDKIFPKYIYTGTIYSNNISKSIGNGVIIPDYYYKVIIKPKCYEAYIGNNQDKSNIRKISLLDLYKLNNMNFNIDLISCS